MTILADDIKLVASRVMQDVPEGGGAPTATVIVDGASNAIFQDISELDRAGGDVSLRKLFIHVQTDNVDTYMGSNVIVAEPPADPNVSVTLFSTGQVFDERSAASGRIESYLVQSSEWAGFLLENHVIGQRAVQLFQRPEEKIPDIGETIILVYREGESGERTQYVRVIATSVVIRTYVDDEGKPYNAANVTCDISDPLRYDFPGSSPNKNFKREVAKTRVRESSVGDAAVYASVATLTASVALGDVALSVDSVFTQLVPSAQTETPLIDQNTAGQAVALTASANGVISYTTSQPLNSATNLSLGNAVTPGTLEIVIGTSTLIDSGGQLYDGSNVVGTVDYANGTVAFASLSSPYNGTKTIQFKPAAAPLRVADTAQIAVTQESRAFNYIMTIVPTPAPGTVLVSYRSQGRWYDLRDNGGGTLRGSDQTYGAGSVNYATGTVSVTLGALPDAGSSVLFSWGSKVNYINRAELAVPNPSVHMQLDAENVTPGSVTITWNDGVARSASDNSKGVITGSASGTIDYATGVIELRPSNLPAGGQEFAVAFSLSDPVNVQSYDAVAPVRNGGGLVAFNLGKTNIAPGTLTLSWPVEVTSNYYQEFAKVPSTVHATDDGNGNIVVETGRLAGTINYATGAISIQPDGPVTGREELFVTSFQPGPFYGVYSTRSDGYAYNPIPTVMPAAGTIKTTFQTGGAGISSTPVVFVSSSVKFDITNRYGEQIVPGSLNFTLGGRRYFDRLGSLYNQLDVVTGAAALAGMINYTTGEIILSDWAPGTPAAVDVDALLTTTGDHTVSSVAFRIPVSPVRPGSVQILATKATGGTINVTAGIDGDIDAAGVIGTVDYETGVVNVEFGAMVTAAGNETKPWYSAEAVVGGMIWRPEFVFADTLRFNAVAYSYLPLDATVLGLDPVRLPQDGRVPIFRRGGFAVLGHTKTVVAAVSNAQTVNLGRVRLSRVRVVGNDGITIPTGYTADLEAGTITFNNVAGYSQPVTIEDRIEDMLQVSDVQISGRLGFTRQITHQYPAGSYLSSALIVNDLKARVSKLFDQATWDTTTWQDVPVGDGATGTYNDTLAPVVVTNRGAVTERWALRFTNSTTFQIIGEHVGVIGTGTINAQCAPLNPATGVPYFVVSELGWGSGWAIGNIVRINTVGAIYPVWAVRTVQQGAESVQDDTFTILVRGDVDRP